MYFVKRILTVLTAALLIGGAGGALLGAPADAAGAGGKVLCGTLTVKDAEAALAKGVSPADLNPCVDIDLSQVEDCRSGTCYTYCVNKAVPSSLHWCDATDKWVSITNWIEYKVGHKPSTCR